jgi:hypothetical protein
LYWQTFGVEWQEQTIKGASPLELRKKTRQTYRGVTGLALAGFFDWLSNLSVVSILIHGLFTQRANAMLAPGSGNQPAFLIVSPSPRNNVTLRDQAQPSRDVDKHNARPIINAFAGQPNRQTERR